MRVKEVLPPDADGVIKIELQSVDSINAYDNYDSDNELMKSHPDYLLTIEELMDQNDLSLQNQDLVVKSIKGHAFDNLQAMVHVEWNHGDCSWELVSDMKSHCYNKLTSYAIHNNLKETVG